MIRACVDCSVIRAFYERNKGFTGLMFAEKGRLDFSRHLEEIRFGLQDKDSQRMRRGVHNIISMSRQNGSVTLSEFAGQLEQRMLAGTQPQAHELEELQRIAEESFALMEHCTT
jgi:hypothetical protein